MKIRQSGMPEADYWNQFFNPDICIDLLFGEKGCLGNTLELGCGYGTFSLAAAKKTHGRLLALDIELELVQQLNAQSKTLDITNILAIQRDFIADGLGVLDQSQMHIMIYNLLHLDDPIALLKNVYKAVHSQGRVSIMHWRSDVPTPRGPSLDIRPKPDLVVDWLEQVGFKTVELVDLSYCSPYHYGLIATI